jgi:prevent-host-death family protein
MKEVTLDQARNDLQALVHEVSRSGAEIVITERGRPAARLSPMPQVDPAAGKAAAERLIALRDSQPEGPKETWEDLKKLMREGLE